MWRLLPVCLLVACAVNEQQPGSAKQQQYRMVRQLELPLQASARGGNGQPETKTFQGRGMEGRVDAAGAWRIEGEVHHSRLRCASYEMGVQLGSGSPACSRVTWLTSIEYATRVRHCNSASRLHAGGGTFSEVVNRLDEITCVRVLVRCAGTC